MIQLENISVQELFQLPDAKFREYQRILSNLKPKSYFGYFEGSDVEDLSFGEVSSITETLTTLEGIASTFCQVFKMKECNFYNGSCIDFFYAFNWIKKQVDQIQESEEFAFAQDEFSDEAEKWKEANKGRLDKFGILNVTTSLGKQFGKLPSEIEALPYHEVFAMLFQSREYNQVYSDFTKPKQQSNDI